MSTCDTVFEHDVVEIDQQFFETFEAFCSKALCIPVSRTHAQDRTGFPPMVTHTK